MATEITWLGHSCFAVHTGKHKLLLDPFLNDCPTAPIKAEEVEADFILVTHGHFDHVGDTVSIAKRTGAQVVANFEICEWLKKQGLGEDQVAAMGAGGALEFPFGIAKMTTAVHSSGLPDGSYGGVAGGFILQIEKQRIYFAGDTALTLDMKLIGIGGLDLAVLPIGDLFTMGPDDAIEAIKLLNPSKALPCHYNTMPPLEQDAHQWADRVRSHTAAEPIILEPGEKFSL